MNILILKTMVDEITLITIRGFRNSLEASRYDTTIFSAPLASSTEPLSVVDAYRTCWIAMIPKEQSSGRFGLKFSLQEFRVPAALTCLICIG